MYRTLFFRYGRDGPAAPPLPRPAFQSLPTHSPLLPPAAPTASPHWSPRLSVSAPRSLIGPRGGGVGRARGAGPSGARAGSGSGGPRLGPARPRHLPRPRRLRQRLRAVGEPLLAGLWRPTPARAPPARALSGDAREVLRHATQRSRAERSFGSPSPNASRWPHVPGRPSEAPRPAGWAGGVSPGVPWRSGRGSPRVPGPFWS